MSAAQQIEATAALLRSGLSLLEREREAILAGTFERLEGLTEEKATLLSDIEGLLGKKLNLPDGPAKNQLRRIAADFIECAAANTRLLEAAREGAEAGAQEMKKTQNPAQASFFYTVDGKKVKSNTSSFSTSSRF